MGWHSSRDGVEPVERDDYAEMMEEVEQRELAGRPDLERDDDLADHLEWCDGCHECADLNPVALAIQQQAVERMASRGRGLRRAA